MSTPRWQVSVRRRATTRAERKALSARQVVEVLVSDTSGAYAPRVVDRLPEAHGSFWLKAAGLVPGGRHVFVFAGASCMGDPERRLTLHPVEPGAGGRLELLCDDRAQDTDVLFSAEGRRAYCRIVDGLGRKPPWFLCHDLAGGAPATRSDALPDEPLVSIRDARIGE